MNAGESAVPSLGEPRTAAYGRAPHDRLLEAGAGLVGAARDRAPELLAMLARVPLFAGLDAADLETLCALMPVYDAGPDTTLMREGELGDCLLVLLSGSVEVLRRDRFEVPSRIAVALAGQVLGEMSLFDGEPRFASCVTIEPVRFALLTRENLWQVVREGSRPAHRILLNLVQLLSERLRQTSARLVG